MIYLALVLVVACVVLTIRTTGVAERAFYHPVRAVLAQRSGVEVVEFESEGRTLHGWFITAADAEPGTRRPVVVHCHGNAGNMEHHFAFAEFLTRHGVHVLMFDYRGYGQSEPGPLRRRGLVEDALAAVTFARSMSGVDADRVGLYGVSLGGTIALAAAARDERVAAVCVVSAFSSWSTIANDHAPIIGRLVIARGVDAVGEVGSLGTRPLLVVHGTDDRIVPFAHGQRIVAAATAAGVDAQLVELPGGRHNDWPITHPDALDEIGTFFRIRLGLDDGPA